MRQLSLVLFSLSFGLIGIARSAHAKAETSRCFFEAYLVGDSEFYLKYGRDSWSGTDGMNCQTGKQVAKRMMKATFNSAVPGVGVDEDSKVFVRMKIETSVPLNNLRIFGGVNAVAGPHGLIWRIETGTMRAEVTVIISPNSPLQNSLRRGTLLIR